LPSSLPLGTGHSDAYNGCVPQLDGYPSSDEFRLAEDDDKAFEEAYRHSIRVLKESGQDVEMFLLNALIETYQKGIISPNIGFERRPRQ
jgi:hypothetical protein